VRQWNALAQTRDVQLRSGLDLSMDHVIVPELLHLAGPRRYRHLLDVGCGSGYSTNLLAKIATSTTGIDPSAKAIEIASRHYPAVDFRRCRIEELRQPETPYDLIIANMMLMNAPDLDAAISGFRRVASEETLLLASITHPVYWPRYWGYEDAPEFLYTSELAVETEFRTSTTKTGLTSTHFHRPLSRYLNALTAAEFAIKRVTEPLPDRETQDLFPTEWAFPRFLFVAAVISESH
jgi:ubiquinone/menaquinone biosynthesis C-methylase UbiE